MWKLRKKKNPVDEFIKTMKDGDTKAIFALCTSSTEVACFCNGKSDDITNALINVLQGREDLFDCVVEAVSFIIKKKIKLPSLEDLTWDIMKKKPSPKDVN